MSESTESSLSDSASSPPSRVRWRFPIIFLAILAAVYFVAQFAGVPRDVLTVASYFLFWLSLIVVCVWAALQRALGPIIRIGAVLLPFIAMGVFSQIDIINDGDARIVSWRWVWADKPDELLEQAAPTNQAINWQPGEYDYPRFLGTGYWAEAPDLGFATDWQAEPPELLWKQEIGAGWSAFSVVGDFAITQEQRGENELVTCYNATTGELIWTHTEQVRFDPDGMRGLGGLGPRATPTIFGDQVYTQGATGIVLCLRAVDGSVVWRQDPQNEFGVANLEWAKSNSPLVLPDQQIVVVAVGIGESDVARDQTGSLVAYNMETGDVEWTAGEQTPSYASPITVTLDGVAQILDVQENFISAYGVEDGQQLWQMSWTSSSNAAAACSQPIPLDGDRILLTKGYGQGAVLFEVSRNEQGEWTTEDVWRRPVLKTKFTNVIIHQGHAYALDDIVLQCVDLESGKSKWKKRRRPEFGHGQIMLVGDNLFVLTEQGEGVLVRASPDRYQELGSMQLITDEGVTWNNPAIAGDLLLVRNDLEAAAFRLPRSDSAASEPIDEAEPSEP